MMEASVLNIVDRVILLLLRAGRGTPVPGPLFLQKEAFALRSADSQLNQDLAFEPHMLGPFSDALAAETEQLELSGLVVSDRGYYRLTDEGSRLAEEISGGTAASVLRSVEETKALLNDLTKDELLAIIYFGTPDEDFEEESVEFRRVKRERRRLAQSLLRRDKVSVSKAAEIAGVGVDEIISGVDRLTG